MTATKSEFDSFLQTYLNASEIRMDISKPLKSSGMDSLELVEFIMLVEEEFNVTIDVNKIDKDKDISQFHELLSS
ncbi:phosphopantetheine-binding protein [Rhizobium sp. NRK18]|uniref:phosphopantetheine-binding protein n=1 Tax=Rhizobium sp. NRK18 TaxID=2964667 RepID=UPI0021C4B99D|nr:phosphopantetheine-binding protein [Rhizobium sp. NRK18]